MGDFIYSDDEDYGIDDRDYLDGLDNVEDDLQFSTSTSSSTQVITKESLLAAQREDLQRVMDLLQLSEQHTRTLLIHHRWDVEKLIAVLVDKGKDQLLGEAGVTVIARKDCETLELSSVVTCMVCMEDIAAPEVTSMDCGHSFCNDCWTEHFIVKINEGQSRRIRCMAHKCGGICDEAIVRRLVSAKDADLAERFERFLLESYIEDNKMVKWCPSVPHCGSAIRIEDDIFREVECSCGLQFCFSCSSEAHSPCSCLMWELWTKKCRDESETVNWITVHTKPCPKCKKSVEKNGGCNLVRCICGITFCWLCARPTGPDHTYTTIHGHSCGSYQEERGKKIERTKQDFYRYMHYHNRHKAHTDSFKLETKLKDTLEKKIKVLEKQDIALKDFSWLTNGLSRLFRSRRVLSYSYPFAFYMFGDHLFKKEMSIEERELKQHLFEDQQQQLEASVEKLSKILEEPFDKYLEDAVTEKRARVINLSVTTDRLCEKMYDCIENDLLGSLRLSTHSIAPYKSKGVERASELPMRSTESNDSDTYLQSNSSIRGIEVGNSASGSLKLESGHRSRKRAKKEPLNSRRR